MRKKADEEDSTNKDKHSNNTVLEKKKACQTQIVDLYWHDLYIDIQKLTTMKRFQRVNHFSGMQGITRKASLAMMLQKMKELFPVDFNFFPKSWNVPLQLLRLKTHI